MSDTGYAIALILPPVILLTAWFILRNRSNARIILSAIWILLLVVFGAFGRSQWQSDFEISIIASTTLATSSTWFCAPLLLITINKKWNPIVSILGALFLPLVGLAICMILMMLSEQVWGM